MNIADSIAYALAAQFLTFCNGPNGYGDETPEYQAALDIVAKGWEAMTAWCEQ
jgi:hypothetical protein